jgi:hypothetical protein
MSELFTITFRHEIGPLEVHLRASFRRDQEPLVTEFEQLMRGVMHLSQALQADRKTAGRIGAVTNH